MEQNDLVTIEIDWLLADGTVEKRKVSIRKLSHGEQAKLKAKIFKPVMLADPVEGGFKPQLLPDLYEMEIQPILDCVVEAPWPVGNLNEVYKLKESVAKQILPRIMEINELVGDQKKSSSTPLNTVPQMPGS